MRQHLLTALLLFSLVAGASAQNKRAAPPDAPLKAGDTAPNFTLKDQNGKEVSLNSFRGKTVALAFYIFAFSGG